MYFFGTERLQDWVGQRPLSIIDFFVSDSIHSLPPVSWFHMAVYFGDNISVFVYDLLQIDDFLYLAAFTINWTFMFSRFIFLVPTSFLSFMSPLDSKCSVARKQIMNYLHDKTSYLCMCLGATTGGKILYCSLVWCWHHDFKVEMWELHIPGYDATFSGWYMW